MTVVILIQVFFRYVIYLPVPWTEELARYLMVWMGMLGSAAALRQGRHLGVRVLVERLPQGVYDRLVAPLVQVIMAGFLGILLWHGVVFLRLNADQNSPAMELSMLWPYLALPVGAGMMILDLVADMLEDHWPTAQGSRANLAAGTLAAEASREACSRREGRDA